eukprot:UC1_evm1s1148
MGLISCFFAPFLYVWDHVTLVTTFIDPIITRLKDDAKNGDMVKGKAHAQNEDYMVGIRDNMIKMLEIVGIIGALVS